jgi:hypothetical protein
VTFENDDPRMNEFKSEPLPPQPKPDPRRAQIPNPPTGAEPGRPGEPERLAPLPILSFLTKVRMFLGAIVGPRVSPEEYRQRINACVRCPDIIVIHKRYGDKMYCGACNCWRWWLAQISRKCRYKLHMCLRGRHPGQSRQRNGCNGCGGNG